jgi:hypothetical protein
MNGGKVQKATINKVTWRSFWYCCRMAMEMKVIGKVRRLENWRKKINKLG